MPQSMVLQRVRHDVVRTIICGDEHLFMCLLATCMSSLEKNLFRSANFFVWVVCFDIKPNELFAYYGG